MTVAEFLAWDAPGETSWELVDGEPISVAPASRTHGALQLELGSLIRNDLADAGNPCTWSRRPASSPGFAPVRISASLIWP
jgi:Uma2 family endonuclease